MIDSLLLALAEGTLWSAHLRGRYFIAAALLILALICLILLLIW